MRLLIVEDSPQLQRSLREGLQRGGYAVDVAATGSDGLRVASQLAYDAIVLDILLPGMSGLNVLKELRARRNYVPVLLLTARDTVADRIVGLRAGADDYLTKPFAFEELVARIEALIRRAANQIDPVIRRGPLHIDTAAKQVFIAGEPISLTAREYALLHYLAINRGKVLSRSQIEEHIYDSEAELMSNVVDSTIYSLRKKIDRPGHPGIIDTRRGQGYIVPAEE